MRYRGIIILDRTHLVVNHEILLKKLKKFGIVGNTLNWFKTYLNNRLQAVDINGSLSDTKHIDCSVLQGSILGPTLFLCFINDFPNSTLLNVFMFADDTTCLCAGKDLKALCNTVNLEIQKMAFWYRTNKMAVNISKTKYMLFGPKGKNTLDIPPIFTIATILTLLKILVLFLKLKELQSLTLIVISILINYSVFYSMKTSRLINTLLISAKNCPELIFFEIGLKTLLVKNHYKPYILLYFRAIFFTVSI